MKKFHVHHLSHPLFRRTVVWAFVLSLMIIGSAAALARSARNFKAALTDKPDLAIYLLLPEEGITNTTLLRDGETERDYLAETKDGPKIVKLKKGDEQWYVALTEKLHQGEN